MLPQRQFGRSKERVTTLGLGGGCLNRRSYDDGVATVRRAVEIGINYIDTSPHYCGNESQSIIGDALRGQRAPVLVATKLGHFQDAESYRSPATLRAQLEDNLRRLGRKSVDVLQVHEADWACWWHAGASPGELVCPKQLRNIDDAPILQVLRAAKDEGFSRYIGITGNNAECVAHVLAQAEIDAVLVAWNYDLLHRGARRLALPLAQRKGVAFIAAAVLHGGLLTDPPTDSHAASSPMFQERLERLRVLQKASGIALSELAVRYLLGDPRISVILVGASTPDEIEQAARAIRAGQLPKDLHKEVEALGLDE
jgi:aryl-alcohol dehydrogenase-like predicted oxidoreductase